jgi:hypothetical protein
MARPDRHLHEEEPAPEVTTPQGTQAYGVKHGHEETDVNPAALIRWFGGLGLFTLATVVLLGGIFQIWRGYERRMAQDVPSPVFKAVQEPPEPRILPNPFDSPQLVLGPRRDTPEAPPGEHEKERADAQRLGLLGPDGRARLPEAAERAVVTAPNPPPPNPNAPYPPGLGPGTEAMPSEASGGTALENELR